MNLIPRNFFLDDVFNDFLAVKELPTFKCDIYEKDNKYFLEADLPGFSKEDIVIEVDNGYLTLKVAKDSQVEDKGKNYIKKERSHQEYQRSFYVGEVKTEDVNALFEDGVLKIEIPKEEKIETKKTIEIK